MEAHLAKRKSKAVPEKAYEPTEREAAATAALRDRINATGAAVLIGVWLAIHRSPSSSAIVSRSRRMIRERAA